MLRSYRSDYVALGLVLGISLTLNALGWLSVGWDWIDLEKARPNTSSYAEQQCARQQAEYATRQATVLSDDQAATGNTNANDPDSAEQNEPNWCDLAAQQSMADSTVGMVKSAWLGTILTFVGVILLYRTLYYTRETLKEAEKATEAALKTVQTERAWISFNGIQHKVEDGHLGLAVRWINSGRSPALDAQFSINSTTLNQGDPQIQKFPKPTFNPEYKSTPLGPQMVRLSLFREFSPQQFELWKSGALRIVLYGYVGYRDFYSREARHTEVCCEVLFVDESRAPDGGLSITSFAQPHGVQNTGS